MPVLHAPCRRPVTLTPPTATSAAAAVASRRSHGRPEWPPSGRAARVRPLPALVLVGLVAATLVGCGGMRPPVDPQATAVPDLVDLATLDPAPTTGIRLDIRYATANNFTGRVVYPAARAFLQRPAAEALLRAHRRLAAEGFGLLVFDGYRPWRVTKMFWDQTPPSQRDFVADPRKGSRHNRGCAVDVTLYELATGREVTMPSGYDDFTERAHPDYAEGDATARAHRDRLRRAMEAEGFTVYANEWWHFDFAGWERWPVLDWSFAEVDRRRAAPPR
jgi:D-alanyl-D-alanine dipeptidase